MKHQTGGLGGRVVTYFCANKLFGHHNGMEDVLRVCGNRSSTHGLTFPSPSLPSPLEVGPLLQVGSLGERFSSSIGSGRQTVFGEFQAKNLASVSHDLQELFRF